MVPAPYLQVRRTMSATGEQYVVDEHGNRVAVILPLQEYEQLQEDLHDLAVVAERREEPTVGFSEFRKRYEQ
jgi:prevent-host-death family protein